MEAMAHIFRWITYDKCNLPESYFQLISPGISHLKNIKKKPTMLEDALGFFPHAIHKPPSKDDRF